MSRLISSIVFFFLFTFTVVVICAQEQQKSEEEVVIRISTELVVIDVQVIDRKSRKIVGNLNKDDFTLYEDGVKQNIAYFSQNKLPLSIVLLLDVSGSVGLSYDQIKANALLALQQLNPEDEIALMAFDCEAALIQGFTQDRSLIAHKMSDSGEMLSTLKSNIRNKLANGTNIGDSIYQAAEYLHKAANPNSRKVIITITDNQVDNTHFLYTMKEVVNYLYELEVAVYGIVIDDNHRKSLINRISRYHPVIWIAERQESGKLGGTVEGYAQKTGGITLTVKSENIGLSLAEAINTLRFRYSFGYTSSNNRLDRTFRKVQLKVSNKVERSAGKVIVLTRQGYYAHPRKLVAPPDQGKSAIPPKQ
jgi:Ca-activated chloride channel homolog